MVCWTRETAEWNTSIEAEVFPVISGHILDTVKSFPSKIKSDLITKMADVATTGSEKSLDDFFAKRDKKKKKEKGKGKEPGAGPAPASVKKTKKEKEKSTKNENQDAQVEKVCRSFGLLYWNI